MVILMGKKMLIQIREEQGGQKEEKWAQISSKKTSQDQGWLKRQLEKSCYLQLIFQEAAQLQARQREGNFH